MPVSCEHWLSSFNNTWSCLSRFIMSSHLQWMVIRNCSSFLIKRNGQTYSTVSNLSPPVSVQTTWLHLCPCCIYEFWVDLEYVGCLHRKVTKCQSLYITTFAVWFCNTVKAATSNCFHYRLIIWLFEWIHWLFNVSMKCCCSSTLNAQM